MNTRCPPKCVPLRPAPKWEEPEHPTPKWKEPEHPEGGAGASSAQKGRVRWSTAQEGVAEHPQPKRGEPEHPQHKRGKPISPAPKRGKPKSPVTEREPHQSPAPLPPLEGDYLLLSPPPLEGATCCSCPPRQRETTCCSCLHCQRKITRFFRPPSPEELELHPAGPLLPSPSEGPHQPCTTRGMLARHCPGICGVHPQQFRYSHSSHCTVLYQYMHEFSLVVMFHNKGPLSKPVVFNLWYVTGLPLVHTDSSL
ncbi:UNVERIFIED_CONTAM: hypothetical protein FKN15_032673 [Acipenser sinensis]